MEFDDDIESLEEVADEESNSKAIIKINNQKTKENQVKPSDLDDKTKEENQNDDEIKMCKICYKKMPLDKMIKLECGHSFCSNCLIEMIKFQILKQG